MSISDETFNNGNSSRDHDAAGKPEEAFDLVIVGGKFF